MYYGGRYYNSNIGRFISPDINRRGDVLTYNRYIYTRNNPFRYTDPTGWEEQAHWTGLWNGIQTVGGYIDYGLSSTGEFTLTNALGYDSAEELGYTVIAMTEGNSNWDAVVSNPYAASAGIAIATPAIAYGASAAGTTAVVTSTAHGTLNTAIYGGVQYATGQEITWSGATGAFVTGVVTGQAGNVGNLAPVAWGTTGQVAAQGVTAFGAGFAGNSLEQGLADQEYNLGSAFTGGLTNATGYGIASGLGHAADEVILLGSQYSSSIANYGLTSGVIRGGIQQNPSVALAIPFSTVGYTSHNLLSETSGEFLWHYGVTNYELSH